MPVDTPFQPEGRKRSNRASAALVTSPERGDVDAVNSVAYALPPEEGRPGGHSQSLLNGEAQVWIERQRIGRADEPDGVRVSRSGKEGIKGLQSMVARVFIPARRVGAQAQPGFERNLVYRVTQVRRQRPGADVEFTSGTLEVSPLKNRIEVVIELPDRVARCAVSSRDESVAEFASDPLIEAPYFAIQSDVRELVAAADLRS